VRVTRSAVLPIRDEGSEEVSTLVSARQRVTPRHSANHRPLRITSRSVRPRRPSRRESQIEPWLTPRGDQRVACNRLNRIWRTPIMSQQRTTTPPPTRKHRGSSPSSRSELTAKGKTEKQSAKKRTALDSRFHRTNAAGRAG